MKSRHKPYGPYERLMKRPMDVICGILFVMVFWWLYLMIAVFVKFELGSPVLFTQERPGKNARIFKLYKFRTMTDECNEKGKLLPDEIRLNQFGKFLRSTSLDELPEIFNIIKGDMSIIGPRPLLVRYLPYYSDTERHRHDVRPGLTGYSQAHGRNALTWEKRFELDVKYVEKITLCRDIRIIIDTIKAVTSRNNISLNGLEDFDEYRKKQNKNTAV